MSTRAQQFEVLAGGVTYDGALITTPYAKFLAAGTTTAKDAYADVDKAVAITKKALDAQGRAVVYGDGIYKLQIYAGDPDNGGVLKFEIDNYKVSAVSGNTRTVTEATVAGSIDDSLVVADTTSNDITYTLPLASLTAGKIFQLAKLVAANTLTVSAATGNLVNGAASVAYTAINSTGIFQSDGSNYYVFQTVGDAATLGGYPASTTPAALTIPVYDANADLTATKIGVLHVKVVDIGDWNMDATGSVTVAHGLDLSKIRSIEVYVRPDDGSGLIPLAQADTAGAAAGYWGCGATTISLVRIASSTFDGVSFDSTSFNRGWVTFWYVD